jgi:hypothetical protein
MDWSTKALYWKWKCVLTAALTLAAPGGCGTIIGNPKKPVTSGNSPGQKKTYVELISYQLDASINSATEDLADMLPISQTAFMLKNEKDSFNDSEEIDKSKDEGKQEDKGVGKNEEKEAEAEKNELKMKANSKNSDPKEVKNSFESKHQCSENNDGSVTITRVSNGEAELSFQKKKNAVTISAKGASEASFVVKKSGSKISCNKELTDIAWESADRSGVSIAEKFTKSRKTKTKSAKAEIEREAAYTENGTRTVTLSQGKSDSSSEFLLKKEISMSMDRKIILIENEQEKEVKVALQTVTENPLLVNVVTDKTTGAWLGREIQSGSTQSDTENGQRTLLTFQNVKYSAESRCLAESGNIEGKVIDVINNVVLETFRIEFTDEGAFLNFKGLPEKIPYLPDGCGTEENK